jgi:transcriptional regulator with XRE-family HTH domain
MRKYNKLELELLNIQIGCMLRLARLKKGLSQHDLAVKLEYNPTMIGRVERFENVSSWDKIFSISQQLNIDFYNLFILQNKDQLLSIVEESFKFEAKLTQEKKDYYNFLQKTIVKKFSLLAHY